MLGIARNMAWDILEEDPTLSFEKNRMMGFQLKKMKTNPVNWSAIS